MSADASAPKKSKDDKPEDPPIRPIADFAGKKPPAPDWFEAALAEAPEQASVDVEGTPINYLAWGKRGAPGMLFIHGGRAHAQWWTPFAPFFSKDHRVVAMDLGGLGDSGRRERYSMSLLVEEVFAVAEAAGLYEAGRPMVVGHSFGGYVTLACVEQAGERLKGAVVVDSPIRVPDPDEGYNITEPRKEGEEPKPIRPNRVYPTLEEPIARFRFLPNQPCANAFLADHIARTGLTSATDDDGTQGWAWKFDPAMGSNFDIHYERDLLLAARCPLAFIYGEKSKFCEQEWLDHVRKMTGGRSPIIVLPDAHHHLMMDQPIAFISALRALFSTWPVRVGF